MKSLKNAHRDRDPPTRPEVPITLECFSAKTSVRSPPFLWWKRFAPENLPKRILPFPERCHHGCRAGNMLLIGCLNSFLTACKVGGEIRVQRGMVETHFEKNENKYHRRQGWKDGKGGWRNKVDCLLRGLKAPRGHIQTRAAAVVILESR